MTKPELGTKRIDPETGKKFYDLNRDPVISPYTGISYPRSFFETSVEKNDTEEEDLESENNLEPVRDKPEFISLSDVEDNEKDDDLPDLGDDEVDLENDDVGVDDTFLQEDDEDADVTDIIGSGLDSEDEN